MFSGHPFIKDVEKWNYIFSLLKRLKMLAHLLSGREIGVVNNLLFKRLERYKRAMSLELRNDSDMEQCFSSAVNSLDVEKQENR